MKRKGINVTEYPFNTNQGNTDLMLLKLENKSLLALPYYLKSLDPVHFASYITLFSVIAKISELFCFGFPVYSIQSGFTLGFNMNFFS